MNIDAFIQRWSQSTLREQQAAQSHFNEVCALVGQTPPTQADPRGIFFTFEEQVAKPDGSMGRADVWYKGHFAWEYKGKHKSLDAAYIQLLTYSGDLANPPLLVVCDFEEYRIYPQFRGYSTKPLIFHNADLAHAQTRQYLEWLFTDPDEFLRWQQREQAERERLTERLASEVADLAERLRAYTPDGAPAPSWSARRVARFLTRVLFTLFVEDTRLLPIIETTSVFRYIVDNAVSDAAGFVQGVRDLFMAMDGQRDRYATKPIPYFNGGLFAPDADENGAPEVLDITAIPGALSVLQRASDADWRRINPTIFGTLFERALDPSKRAQLGAHYTSEADIRLILDPVLMQPLYADWDAISAEAETDLKRLLEAATPPRDRHAARERLTVLHDRASARLEATRILDPACGSGNFLYVSLRLLKDLEKRVRERFAPLELAFRDGVTPRQLYGIEKDEFAASLARVVVWIGYLQWRFEDEGTLHPQLSGRPRTPYDLPNPIIDARSNEYIVCDDALLRYTADGTPYEPAWAAVDVIVGNPPFLGGKKLRGELGDTYIDDLFRLYRGRVAPEADLVTYWHEKARGQIEAGTAARAGLLSTNSIRGGANRRVLERIKASGDIFMAWSDQEWVLEGAAVRVSMVGFDNGAQAARSLDGAPVETINADLTAAADLTTAARLTENRNLAFMGVTPAGTFDIDDKTARTMLEAINPSGKSNADVVKRWSNASDLVRQTRGVWTIDFGVGTSETDAAQYELPFKHIQTVVKPQRSTNNRQVYRERWWQYAEARPEMRRALAPLSRYLVTPLVSKHRVFVWVDSNVIPANLLNVFARDDDYFFGVLHSRAHEIWSLRMGTSLEDRPRYTPTTTFETFPFPYLPGREPTADPAYARIAAAARALHEQRTAWLHPPDMMQIAGAGVALRERTLTTLYNALADYRAGKTISKSNAAQAFAPTLAALHAELDRAVLAAYGWADGLPDKERPAPTDQAGVDDVLLGRLLALNRAREG